MKTSFISISLLVLFILSIQGQGDTKITGSEKIDLEFIKDANENGSEAIVLFDKGKSYFVEKDGSFDIVFERNTRIKILTENGKKWANIDIPVYHQGDVKERVTDINAFSFNEEIGKPKNSSITTSDTLKEVIDKQWDLIKFSIPDVEAGSIIEYSYKIYTQFVYKTKGWEYNWKIPVMYSEYEVNNIRDWEFQWRIPVVYSEYIAKMIPFYEYTFLLQGAKKFDSQTSYVDKVFTRQFGVINYQDLVYTFVMKDLPAFNNEEFITSINDYIIKIDFQLSKINYPNGGNVDIMTSWDKMGSDLLKSKDFGQYIKKAEKLAPKLLKAEKLNALTENEKFDHIIEFVKSNYKWDGQNGKYASLTPGKFIKERTGNCADINLFTIGLLRDAGIDAKAVLISTRNHGKIKYDYPYTHFFNYVVILANIDGQNILTDATEVLNQNNRIPSRCINDKGLIIEKDKVVWTGLECLFTSEIKTNIQIDFHGLEIIKANISKTATEYDAFDFRNNFNGNDLMLKHSLKKEAYLINDSSIKIKNPVEKDKPYILSFDLESSSEVVGDNIYISPFMSEISTENPLKQNKRSYPVDLTYPKKRVFTSIIAIPEGYQIETLPAKLDLKNQLYELKYSTKSLGDKVEVTFEYVFNNSVYAPDEYLEIKSVFNIIAEKGNEKIVLSKD